ncbi:hypothetical protein BC829DRAFT_79437 [Chytridium lagenaria]|nr:hypothetical protein BC829DRAFT_79437 [Chytridium lagenaria]
MNPIDARIMQNQDTPMYRPRSHSLFTVRLPQDVELQPWTPEPWMFKATPIHSEVEGTSFPSDGMDLFRPRKLTSSSIDTNATASTYSSTRHFAPHTSWLDHEDLDKIPTLPMRVMAPLSPAPPETSKSAWKRWYLAKKAKIARWLRQSCLALDEELMEDGVEAFDTMLASEETLYITLTPPLFR